MKSTPPFQNSTINYCACCATDLRVVPAEDLEFCFKCGANMRAVRIAWGFLATLPNKKKTGKVSGADKLTGADRVKRVKELTAQGLTIAAIARKLHIAKSTASAARAGITAAKVRTRIKAVTPEIIAQVEDLKRTLPPQDSKRATERLIAGRVHISTTTVSRILKRAEAATNNHVPVS